MLTVYWVCLMGGVIFALVTIVFGEVLGDLMDGVSDILSTDHLDFLHPMVVVGGITVLGGSGIMLSEFTRLGPLEVFVLSCMLTVVVSFAVYFGYVRPMRNCENSIGYSVRDLVGKVGEVTVPIPAQGYGELVIKTGAGITNQIAASHTGEEIASGTMVVVAEVRDGTFFVFRQKN